ncbi:MAG: tyrosine-type recombinase/integrase [Armatimonadetes bacterium]|nr:tyrosine-type recombinase/integrase [Armatimonadota bacterium]MDE2205493.1 tyrosine-type recombinase/integrase [Armatimonadota bacterium]
MNNRAPRFTKTEAATIGVNDLERYADGWLLSGEIDQHSARTLGNRRSIVSKLVWFLREKNLDCCGTMELRQFLAYVTNGHQEAGGRWGNAQQTRPVRPRTVHTYHGHLRTLFRWIVSEDGLGVSPMERIPVPTSRADQVQPFTTDQVEALLNAAKRSQMAYRNQAIVYFLLDTGLRASELCSLNREDVDFQARRCGVVGKGNKRRMVPFGKTAAKSLWNYLKAEPQEPGEPLFMSERGERLTRSGLRLLFVRLGRSARLQAARCSPHTFRHTFAVEFLRAGGNVFTLQQILGHTSLTMTNRYVALAQADIENQHRQYSPADRLRRSVR